MVRSRFTLPARLIVLSALLLSFVLSLGTVAAAAPTVAANPALVPFDTTPGKPGTTTLTFTANGTTGLTACGQDNAVTPFKLGPVDPATPLVIPFPFIQAGKYTFWVSTDSTCATGTKLMVSGNPVQATASRVGPTGAAAQDAVQFRITGQPNMLLVDTGGTSNSNSIDLTILGQGLPTTPTQQMFPIPGVQLCIMSGDGATVNIAMKVGQDSRTAGLGSAAATTTVNPVAGQNGCFAIPWVVNGGYTATIARSGANSSFGFCGSLKNTPSVPPTATIGKCAQVAFFAPTPFLHESQHVDGSIVTGADNHAVQVCVSAFAPPSLIAPPNTPPGTQLANTVNAYNQSGAVNLTPLTLSFTRGTKTKVTTYDITGPGPGGQGGAQFPCPTATAKTVGNDIVISEAAVPGATIIDTKSFFNT